MLLAAFLLWQGRLLSTRLDPLGADARLAVPVHREHRGLDDRRAGPAALARLRAPATADGTVARVGAGDTLFTLLGFMGLYMVLGLLFLFLVVRAIARGPSAGAPLTGRRRRTP